MLNSRELSFEQMSPMADPTAKLLLLTARHNLSCEERETVVALIKEGIDWSRFERVVTKKFSATFAYRNLKHLDDGKLSSSTLSHLRMSSRRFGMATLRIMAAQISFHEKCLVPCDANYAYMKGIALAQQFGMNPSDRFCRDIDVLIASEDIRKVVLRAIALGYKVVLSDSPPKMAQTDQDIDFVIRHGAVITLISPEKIAIEVHRRLGKTSVTFETSTALNSTEEVQISGLRVRTLSKSLHFVYICYHHGRHYWSHLHWLADLNAIVRSNELDLAEVKAQSDAVGIRPTIEAAFEFHDLTSNPNHWDKIDFSAPGATQFLKACLVNLDEDVAFEKRIRDKRALGEFISNWQYSSGRRHKFVRNSWRHRLRPTVNQYLENPRPSSQHWIYFGKNFLTLCRAAAARFFIRSSSLDQRSIEKRNSDQESTRIE